MHRRIDKESNALSSGCEFARGSSIGSRTPAGHPRSRGVRRALALLGITLGIGVRLAHATLLGPPLDGEPIAVSTASGYQVYASVSGDWVVYSSIDEGSSEVRYFDLETATDQAIPSLGGQDFLAAIDGSNVVYIHLHTQGVSVYSFDLATGGPPVEIDPRPNPQRSLVVIGGDTVAWADYSDPTFFPAIVVYDRVTGVASPLTTHERYNIDPRLSPDGGTLVWTRCVNYPHVPPECDIWQATRGESGWSSSPLSAEPGVEETRPDTDGVTVVYIRGPGREIGEVAWRPVGGGSEQTLDLPGAARYPRISGGIVAFEYLPPEGTHWEIWLYDLSNDTVRQAAAGLEDLRLPDLFVAADGRARLAWSSGDDWEQMDLYARTFQVPTATPVDEIEDLRSLVLSFGLPHGITTSLTVKLVAAIAAIEAGDLGTACTKLADFEAQVRAQSGKALTWEQAAALLAAAEVIESVLGC